MRCECLAKGGAGSLLALEISKENFMLSSIRKITLLVFPPTNFLYDFQEMQYALSHLRDPMTDQPIWIPK